MIGKLLSHYKIVSELGRGGMGIVYKAEDTNLQRTVAIKVLPSSALASEDDRTRFYREARAAASLSHPNIAVIHHIGEDEPRQEGQEPNEGAAGHPYIVMEYIEGETLSELVEKGPLKLSRTITLGSQIAGALQAAHEEKIVHRDIKSANVMLSRRGEAKVLDFGLAQTAQSTKLTAQGTIVGTIGYMSPEQARGEDVDSRTDIWALGVVLYEMVTGSHPFPGEYQQAVVYSILNTEPEPVTSVRTGVPMELERIIGKCLKKDRKSRYQHADDLIADLREVDIADSGTVASRVSTVVQPVAESSKPKRKLIGISATVVALAAFAAWFFLLRAPDYTISVASVNRITTEDGIVFDPTIHPNGDIVTYSAFVDGERRLLFRSTAGGPPTVVAEGFDRTQRGAEYSPDGTRLVFKGPDGLYLVDTPRGVPTPLLQGPVRAATWSPDGISIAYTSGEIDSLFIYNTASRTYSVHGSFERPHSPSWSPDGKRIVLVSGGTDQLQVNAAGRITPTSLWIISFDGSERRAVIDDEYQDLSPIWTPDGRKILFTSNRGGGHDIWSVNASGPPNLSRITTGFNFFVIGLSADGKRLVANENTVTGQNIYASPFRKDELVFSADATPITSGDQVIESMAVSPDGKWLAYASDIEGGSNIFKIPITGGLAQQITSDSAPDFIHSWSRDGESLAFYRFRNGWRNLYSVNLNDLSVDPVLEGPQNMWFPSWSSDGQMLGYRRDYADGDFYEIMRKNQDGSWGDPKRIASGVHTINMMAPIDNMLAYYVNNEDVFIVDLDFDPPKVLHQISYRGIFLPTWSLDGSRVFFTAGGPEGYTFYSYELATKEIRAVVAMQGGYTGGLAYTADNENLYYTIIEQTTDIWALELEYE